MTMSDKQEPGPEPVAWRWREEGEEAWYVSTDARWGASSWTEPLYPASTITAKEAEIAGLRAERDEAHKYAERLLIVLMEKHYPDRSPEWAPLPDLMGVLTQIDNLTTGLSRTDAQSEATHLRKGIETLLNNKPADQSLERVRDRLKAILEEESTAGEATDLRERVSVLETLLHRAVEGPWSNSDLIHARKLLEAKTDG